MTRLRARRGTVQAWWSIPAAWGVLGRGAGTHLTSSSFRAFRFATRSPGGRRSCCVVLCCSSHQAPARGSEKKSWSMRQPPRRGRQFSHGTAVREIAEGFSVPEGQAKSEQAPIRRPPSRGGPLLRSAPSALFFWTVHGPFSFRARPKRIWGVHPAGQAPCGSKHPRGRRPAAHPRSPQGCHRPSRIKSDNPR